jgi:hypothetical protein
MGAVPVKVKQKERRAHVCSDVKEVKGVVIAYLMVKPVKPWLSHLSCLEQA